MLNNGAVDLRVLNVRNSGDVGDVVHLGERFENLCKEGCESKPEGRRMKIETTTKFILSAGLAIGLGLGASHAQTAGQDMKDAGHATKDAAVDTGHATKTVAKKTAHGTKHVAKKTGHATKHAAVATGHRAENVGDAMAGKPEQH